MQNLSSLKITLSVSWGLSRDAYWSFWEIFFWERESFLSEKQFEKLRPKKKRKKLRGEKCLDAHGLKLHDVFPKFLVHNNLKMLMGVGGKIPCFLVLFLFGVLFYGPTVCKYNVNFSLANLCFVRIGFKIKMF